VYNLASILFSAMLLGGCTTVLHSVTDQPVGKNEASTGLGTDISDLTMDTYIGVNIKKADPQLDDSHININVYNAVVLLTGEVPNQRLKVLAGDTARAFKGVRVVHNELAVRNNSTLMARANDALLTTKVKAKLAIDENVRAGDIDVISEDSVVYLMGLVSQSTGAKAANRARETGGARRVATVFEYIE